MASRSIERRLLSLLQSITSTTFELSSVMITEAANKLRKIDLHFDPYSDTAESDYGELKETVEDRPSFIRLRNTWNSMRAEEQRMLWLAATEFGDDGENFQRQVRNSLPHAWRLGIERNHTPSFASIYEEWAAHAS
jgi:hypothetical protein